MRKQIRTAVITAAILACMGTCALADSWNGTTEVLETAHVTAPADGLLLKLSLEAGETVTAGENIGEIGTEKVFAPFDGTVVSVAAKEGEESDGAVLEISPVSLYSLTCTVSNVAESFDEALVHTGEKLYLRCTADGSHRAEAVVISVNGAEFTAETTAGELYVGETVWLYRNADYTKRVGKGTVTVHETITLSSEGTILNLRVKAGDTIERGQWLYSVSSSDETVIRTPAAGIVTEIAASAGEEVEKDKELAVIAISCAIRIEVAADDVRLFRTGSQCRFYRGDDPHETAHTCIVHRILLHEGDSGAVVELIPENGELLPLRMSIRVETD